MNDKEKNLFTELKRRNVFRVGLAYILMAWILLQIADVLFPALSLPEWTTRFIAALLILGFPLAIFFAWAFELTPDGIKRESAVDRIQSITPQTGRKLDFVIIGVLVAGIGILLLDKFVLQDQKSVDTAQSEVAGEGDSEQKSSSKVPGPSPTSIAVLPFADMSPEGDSEYFADGLSEELLNVLAKLKSFQVIGRTSSFAFKGKDDDLRTIGQKLNVANILEGSVRKSGNQIRVTAQLVSVSDGFHLWSASYDRELNDIFAIQDEIATEVAKALRVTLIGNNPVGAVVNTTTDMEAFTAYLLGRQKIRQASFESIQEAKRHLEQALLLDPNFAAAHTALADAWVAHTATGAVTMQEMLAHAQPALEKALALKPNLGETYAILGKIRSLQRQWPAASEAFERAFELNPNSAVMLEYFAEYLVGQGNLDRAIEMLNHASLIEPLSVSVRWEIAQFHLSIGEYEKSLLRYKQIREIDPSSPYGFYGPAYVYNFSGNLDDAIRWLRKSVTIDPNDFELQANIAGRYVDVGNMQEARKWLDKALSLGSDEPMPRLVETYWYSANDELDRAIELSKRTLEQGLDDRFGVNSFFLSWIKTDALHEDVVNKSELEGIITLYDLKYPFLKNDKVQFNFWAQTRPAADLAHLLAVAGYNQRADRLAEAAIQYMDSVDPRYFAPNMKIDRSSILMTQGKQAEALLTLRQAVDLGARVGWRAFITDSVYDPVRETAEFQGILQDLEADATRMRESLQEHPDLPPGSF